MTTDEQTQTTHGERVRLTLDISPELQQRIQRAAAQRNQTVQEYAERVLEQVAPDANATSAQVAGEAAESARERDPFWGVRQSILETTCGRLLDDSVEEIRRMREERTLHLESL